MVGGTWGAECCCHAEEQKSLAFQSKGLKFLMGPFGSPPYGQARLYEHFQKGLSEGSDAFELYFLFFFLPDPLPLGF